MWKEGIAHIEPMKYLFSGTFAEHVLQWKKLGILSAQQWNKLVVSAAKCDEQTGQGRLNAIR